MLNAASWARGRVSQAKEPSTFAPAGLHGSIYGTAKTPGVGEYDVQPPAAPPPAAAGSAAFQGPVDRFGGPNSLYTVSDAPGPGRFAPDDAVATPGGEAWTGARGLAGAQQATFASGTDRFAGTTPGSLYGAAAASVPGAGEYNPEMNDKIKGLVKLQAPAPPSCPPSAPSSCTSLRTPRRTPFYIPTALCSAPRSAPPWRSLPRPSLRSPLRTPFRTLLRTLLRTRPALPLSAFCPSLSRCHTPHHASRLHARISRPSAGVCPPPPEPWDLC